MARSLLRRAQLLTFQQQGGEKYNIPGSKVLKIHLPKTLRIMLNALAAQHFGELLSDAEKQAALEKVLAEIERDQYPQHAPDKQTDKPAENRKVDAVGVTGQHNTLLDH